MDVYDCIKNRRSVRSYRDTAIEDEKLERVLDAARLAPSANNRQNWKFIVVKDRDLRSRLAEAAKGQRFVAEAPVVIAACATKTDHIMSCGHPSHLVDLAIAIDHMTLAARELGLGSCWIGAFDRESVEKILNVPAGAQVIELLPIGYPTEWPLPTSRKGIDEIISVDSWQ